MPSPRPRADAKTGADPRGFDALSAQDQRAHLDRVAERALEHWGLGGAALDLLSLSENATYRVDAPQAAEPLVMRVHRTNYHSLDGIRTELDWMAALQRDAGVQTPQAIAATDGRYVHTVETPELGESRFVDLFEFIPGAAPDESRLLAPFRRLGRVTARLHAHAREWPRPPHFDRLVWDFDGCIGARQNWGDWRDAPGFDAAEQAVLEHAQRRIGERLARFGDGPDRFGLIHADLRLANLLEADGDTRVIDFDDCGLGWFMYDVAGALSFIETRDDVDALVEAWVAGYREHAALDDAQVAEIPTFIMLRRMTLLAWVASHPQADMAIEQGARFGADTVALAERYLDRFDA